MYFEELNNKLNVLAKSGMRDSFYVRHEGIDRNTNNTSQRTTKGHNYREIRANGYQLSLFS